MRECNGALCQLFIDFEKTSDSVRSKLLYNILIEFGIPTKTIRPIQMSSNESESRRFTATAFQLCFTICHNEGPIKSGRARTEW
jgi:hypothetical protein